MNKKVILSVAAVLLFSACNNTPQNNTTESPTDKQEKSERKVVRKTLAVPNDFNHITNVGAVDIIYTPGDKSIEVEGDSALIQYLETTFDPDLLSIGLAMDSNHDINVYGKGNSVKVYISTPSLQCVSVCGSGSFTFDGTWTNTSEDEVQVGVLGTGAINLGDVECPSFRLECTQNGPVNIKHLKATNAIINTRSTSNITADLDVENLSLFNTGNPTIKLTGKAKNKIFMPKDGKGIDDQTRE